MEGRRKNYLAWLARRDVRKEGREDAEEEEEENSSRVACSGVSVVCRTCMSSKFFPGSRIPSSVVLMDQVLWVLKLYALKVRPWVHNSSICGSNGLSVLFKPQSSVARSPHPALHSAISRLLPRAERTLVINLFSSTGKLV